MIVQPAFVFDRSVEWSDLSRFATDQPAGSLGIMWGARRVGKSFLLGAFCEQVGGLYIQAVRQEPVPFLAGLGQVLGERLGAPAPLSLPGWPAALDALLSLPGTPLVVLDEFPYLVESSPELPTTLQAALEHVKKPQARLVLCGSAVSQMTRLLASDGPLYRRALLSLAVRPFDFRTAARFWQLDARPVDAVRVHAIVGGAPGYQDVLGLVGEDVDDWIVRRVLDPTTTLFHEDDLVFSVDPSLPDSGIYRSILAAIVAGERTPTGIARITGRKASALTRFIDRLVGAGLVTRTPDPLRAKRGLLDVADPFLRFHYAIVRPNRPAIARRRGDEVWERSKPVFKSQVLGPHFEHLCRESVLDFDLGFPPPVDVGATVLYDTGRHETHEVDVVGTDEQGRITILGEAKASDAPRTLADVRRLDHLRALLPAHRRADEVHLALFCLNGADARLRAEAERRYDLTVVDAAALCGPAG